MKWSGRNIWLAVVLGGLACSFACAAVPAETPAAGEQTGGLVSAFWFWPAVLFLFAFTIGVVAPVSGVGGGVLFVPLATALFPFSVDFVRGTGLVMALVSAQSSAPHLIRKGLANLRIMAPVVVVSIIFSVLGSLFGLWITNALPSGEYYVMIALGVLLMGVFVVMYRSRQVHYPEIEEVGPVARALELSGMWYEPERNGHVHYHATRLRLGLLCFAAVGFFGGMFGVGAGWANVPVLNLVMGAPIKVATGTSMAIMSVNAPAAAWVYLGKGAILPLIVLPSVAGITIGARIGARVAHRTKPAFVKYLVLGVMLLAAVLDIAKGLRGLELI